MVLDVDPRRLAVLGEVGDAPVRHVLEVGGFDQLGVQVGAGLGQEVLRDDHGDEHAPLTLGIDLAAGYHLGFSLATLGFFVGPLFFSLGGSTPWRWQSLCIAASSL